MALATLLACVAPRIAAASTEICSPLAPAVAHAGMSQPTAVVAADVNHDAHPDLIITSTFAPAGLGIALGQGGDASFAAPTSYGFGAGLLRVATGDFNGDGNVDLVAGGTDNALHVLIGDGTGGFTQTQLIGVGGLPQSVVAADFNRDGRTDVAAVTSGGQVRVALGDGLGGVADGRFFDTPASYDVGYLPSRLIAADLDQDGILDLACTLTGDVGTPGTSIAVLHGQTTTFGAGSFDPAVLVPVGSRPLGIVAGDFNEDGLADLAVSESGDSVVVLIALGNGSFAAPVRYATGAPSNRDLIAGDFTNDGITDLLVANITLDQLVLLKGGGSSNVGDGTFPTRQAFAAGSDPSQLVADDFNGDHLPDIAAPGGTGQFVTLLGGCFGLPSGITVTSPNGGELETIGARDTVRWTRGAAVMAVNVELSRDGGARWQRIASNVTDTKFVWSVKGPVSVQARVRVFDANASDRADTTDGAFTITFPDPFHGGLTTPGGAPLSIVDADFDADGVLDLGVLFPGHLMELHGGGSVSGIGDGTFVIVQDKQLSSTSNPLQLATADLNGDGALDLMYTFQDTAGVQVFDGLVNGFGRPQGEFAPAGKIAIGDTGIVIASGDFNEDGILDLAVTRVHGGIAIVRGNGSGGIADGTFAPPAIVPGGGGAVAAVDVNLDGITDLVAPTGNSSGFEVLIGHGVAGRGDGTFLAPAVYATSGQVTAIVTGDFNRDGAPDLAIARGDHNATDIYLGHLAGGRPDGTFSLGSTVTTFSATDLAVVDLNADGVADLIANEGSGIRLLMGLQSGGAASGTFGSLGSIIAPTLLQICVGDFREDLTPDVIGASVAPDGIRSLFGDFLALGVLDVHDRPQLVPMPPSVPLGSEQVVSWIKGDRELAVNLEVSHDNGRSWLPIARNLTGSSYVWSVTPPATTHARLRVVDPVIQSRVAVSDSFAIAGPTAVDGPAASVLALSAAPNPSRGATRIALTLPAAGPVDIAVYDVGGRAVRTLASGWLPAGVHEFAWDGVARDGRRAPSGLYFLRAHGGQAVLERKLVRID